MTGFQGLKRGKRQKLSTAETEMFISVFIHF